VSPHVRQIFLTRSKIIKALRHCLDSRGFVEIETPILQFAAGGANAQPFETYSDALKERLFLRIAPELFLKRVVVGGIEKVYEIGKNFRNESIDLTHHPEFTTCEFYEAYSDYYKLMDTTQEILKEICISVTGSPQIRVTLPSSLHSQTNDKEIVIDFSKPFRRISILEELERVLGVKLPDVNSPDSISTLRELCEKNHIEVTLPITNVRLFDALVEYFIERHCIQPTFLCDFPICTSPLARHHRSKGGVTERFELFIVGMEFVNAYTELNDPQLQREQFLKQHKLKRETKLQKLNKENTEKEKDEAKVMISAPEEQYCQVLEYALPPCGGWGLGIDRLTMLLTNRLSIKEVLLFPLLKSEEVSSLNDETENNKIQT
jgi:lysyl-tRNA synthetase class 2